MSRTAYSIQVLVENVVGGETRQCRIHIGCVRSPSRAAAVRKMKKENVRGKLIGFVAEEVVCA